MFVLIYFCSFFYSEGSVIADMELTFNQQVGGSEVDALLTEAFKDKKIGNLDALQIKADGLIRSQLLLHQNFI